MTADLLVEATGIVCPVGLSSEAAYTAVRAGISAYAESSFVLSTPDWEPVVAATIPLRPKPTAAGQELPRLKRLAALAITECLAGSSFQLSDVPLLLAIRESYRMSKQWNELALLNGLASELGATLHRESAVVSTGAAGVFECLSRARALLQAGRALACVVGGVDSLLNWTDLERLRGSKRLRSAAHKTGLVPGEASACLLVTCQDTRALARICGIGLGREPPVTSMLSEAHPTGRGLIEAWSSALADAGLHEREVTWRVSDLTGERYGGMDALLAVSRLFRSDRQGLPIWHPAQSVGCTGAAAGALGIALAARAVARDTAPESGVVQCEASSDDGLRGACLIRCSGQLLRDGPRRESVARPRLPSVVAQHVEDAGFLFQQRERAAHSREHHLESLAAVEQRLAAHLDGLRAADDYASAAGEDGFGAQALASVLAFRSESSQAMEEILTRIAAQPTARAGFVAGLKWLPWSSIETQITKLASSVEPSARLLAFDVAAAHRAQQLFATLRPRSDAELVPWMQGLAWIGMQSELAELRRLRAHDDAETRAWAVLCSTLLGQQVDPAALMSTAESKGIMADLALEVAAAFLPAQETQAWIARLAANAEQTRLHVLLAGRVGDTATVPWLLDIMNIPTLSRAAGRSYTALTGVDLEAAKLTRAAPVATGPTDQPDDESVDMDEDDDWPWPDAERVAHHWQTFAARSTRKVNYDETLRVGNMYDRRSAAFLAKAARPSEPLFDTAAPAQRQAAALGIKLKRALG